MSQSIALVARTNLTHIVVIAFLMQGSVLASPLPALNSTTTLIILLLDFGNTVIKLPAQIFNSLISYFRIGIGNISEDIVGETRSFPIETAPQRSAVVGGLWIILSSTTTLEKSSVA